MTTAKRFEDLEVWQRAKDLTNFSKSQICCTGAFRDLLNLMYRLSSMGPFSKDFGLRDQMRRAKGSAGELRAQLYIALEQEYLTTDEFQAAFSSAELCSRQLASFIHYLESQPNARRVREAGVHYEVQP